MPSGVPKGKKKLTDQELRANRLERDRARAKTPEHKDYMKKYNTSSKVKEKEKIRRETTEYKAIQKKWSLKRSQDPVYKEKKNKYNKRPEVRAKARKLAQTDKYQTKAKEYRLRPEVMAKADAVKVFNAMIRLNVLLTYSKRHSNSDVPCCRCCGENSHTEFLAIDHVLGKRQMDSVPELVKLGYSSKLKNYSLIQWIIDNNFPDGFQTLCHNCNQSKANTKHNSCIHGNRDQTKFKPNKTASYTLNLRMEVFPHYSKIHSNNDVPCCRCCGENSNMEFLAIDHILGKKVMDSIPELIELGYSSKMKKTKLLNWIKNNNYLSNLDTEYFQTLCHNCNVAKGVYGQCPHEKK